MALVAFELAVVIIGSAITPLSRKTAAWASSPMSLVMTLACPTCMIQAATQAALRIPPVSGRWCLPVPMGVQESLQKALALSRSRWVPMRRSSWAGRTIICSSPTRKPLWSLVLRMQIPGRRNSLWWSCPIRAWTLPLVIHLKEVTSITQVPETIWITIWRAPSH